MHLFLRRTSVFQGEGDVSYKQVWGHGRRQQSAQSPSHDQSIPGVTRTGRHSLDYWLEEEPFGTSPLSDPVSAVCPLLPLHVD